jgi:hypothetical protein
MTFPNPANYYLPTPQQFEAEITALDLDDLIYLNHDLAERLAEYGEPRFESALSPLSQELIQWIESLKPDELINLIRWVAERLAWFHLPQTIRAKEAFS